MLVAASPAFSLAYAAASAIRQGSRPPLATWLVAVVVGTITFLPAAFLFGWFAIAAILWLGLAGHAVPAIMAERLAPRRAQADGATRARRLHPRRGLVRDARAPLRADEARDGLLLRSQADATVRVSVFLADVVISPLLYLGAAIVYVDLVARVGLSRDDRRRLRRAALESPRAGSEARPERRRRVPTYLMLTTLTEKGTQTLNSNPSRLREVNRDVEELGAKVLHHGPPSACTTSSTSSRRRTT